MPAAAALPGWYRGTTESSLRVTTLLFGSKEGQEPEAECIQFLHVIHQSRLSTLRTRRAEEASKAVPGAAALNAWATRDTTESGLRVTTLGLGSKEGQEPEAQCIQFLHVSRSDLHISSGRPGRRQK